GRLNRGKQNEKDQSAAARVEHDHIQRRGSPGAVRHCNSGGLLEGISQLDIAAPPRRDAPRHPRREWMAHPQGGFDRLYRATRGGRKMIKRFSIHYTTEIE